MSAAPAEEAWQGHHTWLKTSRLVLTGLWIDALLVMAASAWNGGRSLEKLGDPFEFGVLLGVAVDVGLAAALVGDRALHLEGRTEPWGRALRVTTAVMSGALNCAVPLWLGQYGLACFHAFLPILLIMLAEYAQACTLQFRDIAREKMDASDRVAWENQKPPTSAANPPPEDTYSRVESAPQAPLNDHRLAQPPTVSPAPAVSSPAGEKRAVAAGQAGETRGSSGRNPGRSPAKNPPQKSRPPTAEDVRPLLKAGLGRREIARQLGCSEYYVRQVIERLEAEVKPALHALPGGGH